MHCEAARSCRLVIVDSLDDHGIVAHGAADKAALARKRRRRALVNDPQVAPRSMSMRLIF